MTISNDNTKRVNREKDWHNSTYSKNKYIREDCGKYYTANQDANLFYYSAIRFELNKKKSVVLDYGCGDASYLLLFSPYFERGYGIDISEMRITRGQSLIKKNNIKNVDIHIMDAMHTDFDEHTFDIIYGTAILHHLDLNKALSELKRILKPDGAAIFFEPLGTNFFINLYRHLTPKARTIDEQPFRKSEIDLILKHFPNSQFKYFSFLTLFSVPFRNYKFFKKLNQRLALWDRKILKKDSPFRWLAWICVINLRK